MKLMRELRGALGDKNQETTLLYRLNVTMADIQFEVVEGQIHVRIRNGRQGVPAAIERMADYIEREMPNGTTEIYKDREGDTVPDWPEFFGPEPEPPKSHWERLMGDGS
jgi:hypothetical protein